MTPADVSNPAPALAIRIGLAMTRLRSRLRREQATAAGGLTMSQLSLLGRLGEIGPATASALAQAEHVRAQSVAETVTVLRRQGLVDGQPDPSDGRKILLSLTPAGRSLVASIAHLRDAWLARVLERHVTPAEREILDQAATILDRIADCELEPAPGEGWRV